MPRLLPTDWIRIIAINYLLQLYEREIGFVQEWEKAKKPFIPLIEQLGKVSTLIEVEHLLMKSPPDDLIDWISDLQKLRNYLQDLPAGTEYAQNSSEMLKSYDSLQEKLTPYVLSLKSIAYDWNLRASWAGEELMRINVQKVQQDVLNAAGVTTFFELSDRQIQTLLKQDKGSLPSGTWPINILSLYLAGGRQGFINKLNRRLVEFEKELKTLGVKEIPSALHRHAEWWFDYYVHNTSLDDIADGTIGPKNEAGRYPENIRKAVQKFSKLAGIEPLERT